MKKVKFAFEDLEVWQKAVDFVFPFLLKALLGNFRKCTPEDFTGKLKG